jgi:hypothetical protein
MPVVPTNILDSDDHGGGVHGWGLSESGWWESECHRRADRQVLRQLPTAYIRRNSYEATQLNRWSVTSAVSADSVVGGVSGIALGPEI